VRYDEEHDDDPIDGGRVLGRPTPRIDGPLKTTGRATYAYEHHHLDPAYGFVLGAGIANGRIRRMRLRRARRADGVLDIVTWKSAGPLGKGRSNTAPLLGGPEVTHYHQAIALVIAETWEQARHAAQLIEVTYDPTSEAYELTEELDRAKPPGGRSRDTDIGDFESAFAGAPVQVDATYHTSRHAHAMMEPHATLAAWEDGRLTLWTANQMIEWGRQSMAEILDISPDDVRVVSPFIGGGFGGKLFVRADAALAAVGARMVGRPVKVMLHRPLMFNNTPHRASTIQRIRIGAEPDGTLVALGHECWSGDLPDGRVEDGVRATRPSYAAPHRMTRTRLAELHLPEATAMRAPGDMPGAMALEAAIDELAEELGMDPVELRILNDTAVHPESGKPFSRRKLATCLRRGAERFGFARRGRPATVRDGDVWVGMGVAAAIRGAPAATSAARVRLGRDGRVVVETDMTDIGTGSYTILAQTAAEMLGVPLERVDVRLGDSSFPVASGSGGQWGAASSTSGVYAACVELRGVIAARLGVQPDDVELREGHVHLTDRSVSLDEIASDAPLEAEGVMDFEGRGEEHSFFTFGAHFVEVGVDAYTAEVRIRRMLAVCDSGRIFNPIAARSQVIGAMTMGVGAALMEELVVDDRYGYFVNHDLAQYEVPVHADIPEQEVIFVEGTDPLSSPMKGNGVGELGICGVGAAIGNAVFNAVGVRVREYPITLDKLLPHLPEV